MTTRRRNHWKTRPTVELVIGLAVIATYKLLAHFHVGEIGAPSDIGGGMIALVGLGLVAVGVIDAIGSARSASRRAGR